MNCCFKTMIKLAAGLGVTLAVGYFALPQAQAFILASAPLLLALVCPVAMLAMLFTMKGTGDGREDESATRGATTGVHPEAGDARPDNA